MVRFLFGVYDRLVALLPAADDVVGHVEDVDLHLDHLFRRETLLRFELDDAFQG
jgi:hypothetical protein